MSDMVIYLYKEDNGKTPYLDWINSFKDQQTKIRVQQRIRRLELGNFGDCKNLKNGVHELKLNFGPGYRVYYGLESTKIILLLCGGDKSSQQKDIKTAIQYWQCYKEK